MHDDNNTFKVRFRGVRGSYAVPNSRFLGYGGNTACVEINVGVHLIVLDAGTGIISLGNDLMANYISSSPDPEKRTPISLNIFLSHIHTDHIQGLNFFNPINIKSSKINIMGYSTGSEPLKESLSELLYGRSFPLNLSDIKAKVTFNDLHENDVVYLNECSDEPEITDQSTKTDVDFSENKVKITVMKSSSHPQNGVMLYKVEYKGKSLVYATDKENYIGSDKRLALFARDCDLLIHDSQYTTQDYMSPVFSKQGFGHSTFEMAVEQAKIAHAKKLAFFHLDPTYDDEKLECVEKYYIQKMDTAFIAREGQEIVLL